MGDYVCIHGHFYQPPRENPWLEDVEMQDSAYPYHDWNARINEECYFANTAARVLGEKRLIADIVNNYSRMSFDFGPTLMSWLARHTPETYQRVIESDRIGMELFGGHGPALAQAYNHTILPLCNERDKHTQVIWGLSDFEYRFGRKPEGMWLPETAVDVATLEVLAFSDIKFTILAPHQAKQVRKIGAVKWHNVSQGLDTRVPYLCNLPSGKSIVLFFYDGPISHDISYGPLLQDGESFAKRLLEGFSDGKTDQARLVSIATDGETYGHHHHFGEMALAYASRYIQDRTDVKLTVYGEFLEKFPPQYEVQIVENTAWSCAHGLERWRSNCGCAAGRFPSGKQEYRKPLRNALDMLRDRVAELFEFRMKEFVNDPWQLRNAYIEVLLSHTTEKIEKFLVNYIRPGLEPAQKIYIIKMLEMQRHAMLMYTSCGWFFDDITGIETAQILQYASRVMQLVKEIGGPDIEPDFRKILAEAPTNMPDVANGEEAYIRYAKAAAIDLNRVGAHFAVSSVFEDYAKETEIFCYTVATESYDRLEAGIQAFACGRARLRSNVVLEEYAIDFAVMHLGDQNIIAGVTGRLDDAAYEKVRQELKAAFLRGDAAEVMRLMNCSFEGNNYTLWHLFRDEQRKLLTRLLEHTWQDIDQSFRRIYMHNYTIIQAMRGMNMPLPRALAVPAEFILNRDIAAEIRQAYPSVQRLRRVVDEMRQLGLQLDKTNLGLEISSRMAELIGRIVSEPRDPDVIEDVERIGLSLNGILDEVNLAPAENKFFPLRKTALPDMKRRAESGDGDAARWVDSFNRIATMLKFELP